MTELLDTLKQNIDSHAFDIDSSVIIFNEIVLESVKLIFPAIVAIVLVFIPIWIKNKKDRKIELLKAVEELKLLLEELQLNNQKYGYLLKKMDVPIGDEIRLSFITQLFNSVDDFFSSDNIDREISLSSDGKNIKQYYSLPKNDELNESIMLVLNKQTGISDVKNCIISHDYEIKYVIEKLEMQIKKLKYTNY